jgi:hypothetical protein
MPVRDKSLGGKRTASARVERVMRAADHSGLLQDKGASRIAGRVSAELVEKAKNATGIRSDTDLIQFALASLALEDNFAEAFAASRASIDPDVKLDL